MTISQTEGLHHLELDLEGNDDNSIKVVPPTCVFVLLGMLGMYVLAVGGGQ